MPWFSQKDSIKGWRYSDHRYGGKFRWMVGRLCLELSGRNISDEARKLLDVTKKSLYIGIEKAVIGIG